MRIPNAHGHGTQQLSPCRGLSAPFLHSSSFSPPFATTTESLEPPEQQRKWLALVQPESNEGLQKDVNVAEPCRTAEHSRETRPKASGSPRDAVSHLGTSAKSYFKD